MILPVGYYSRSYKEDMEVVRTKFRWGALLGSLVLLFCIPPFASSSLMVFLVNLSIWIIGALGVCIAIGFCGQLIICQSAFMAVGALSSAILVTKVGIPYLPALLCGALVSGLVGVIIGLTTARVKEFYLALVTLGAYFIIMFTLIRVTRVGPGFKVPPVEFVGILFKSPNSYYYISMVILTLSRDFTPPKANSISSTLSILSCSSVIK